MSLDVFWLVSPSLFTALIQSYTFGKETTQPAALKEASTVVLCSQSSLINKIVILTQT